MDFKGKKVAVIGVGIEGVSTTKYLLGKGAEPVLYERKNIGELEKDTGEEIRKLGVRTFFGGKRLDSLEDFDLIFRSPGVRPDLSPLRDAEKKGAKITSQTKLFFDLCPAPIIGITGTKGKGTTSALIYDMLKKDGKDAYLGGNIGVPPFEFLEKLKPSSIVVLELSSFQLEDMDVSPYIAVVLMITPEHLGKDIYGTQNYHETMEAYVLSKRNIVRFQKTTDFA